MWILTNPHHFLTMCTWVTLSVNANRKKQSLNSLRRCLSSVFLLEQLKSYQDRRNFTQKTVAWSCDMEGHARQCIQRCCELTNKTVEQLFKVSSPCVVDYQFKQEEFKSVREMSEVCSQIVLKSLYWRRIRRPDILWLVDKLARSVTRWIVACDRRLSRLISYTYHTNDFRLLSCGQHSSAL